MKSTTARMAAPMVTRNELWKEKIEHVSHKFTATPVFRADHRTLAQRALERAMALKERYSFRVVVFAWRRRASLKRLVNSLQKSAYFGFKVNLEFHLDGEASERVLEYVSQVDWQHGTIRTIMESWEARSDDEFAFFFEDDIEVAPRFFEYSVIALEKYILPGGQLANQTVLTERFFGISLVTPRYNEIAMKPVDWIPSQEIGMEESQFLFQLPSSWGALLIPWFWRQFLQFYRWRRDKDGSDLKQSIPDSAVRYWRRSWKKFLIEFMYMRGLYMLYPALERQISFSTHHREPGEHTKGRPEEHLVDELGTIKLNYFTVPLALEKDAQQVDRMIAEMKPLSQLPIVSFHHERVQNVHALTQLGLFTVEVMEKHGWDHSKYRVNPTCVLDTITFPVHGQEETERFLIYEPQLSLGHQLNALQNAAAYAAILNRTLVLPPLVAPSDHTIRVALEQIADFDKHSFVKMLPVDDFIARHDGWIDRVAQFVPWTIRDRNMMKMRDNVLIDAGFVPAGQAILHVFPTKEQEIRQQFGGCQDQVLAFRHLFGSFTSFADPERDSAYRQWTAKLKVSKPIRVWIQAMVEQFDQPLACVEYSRGDDPTVCGADLDKIHSLTDEQASILQMNCRASLEETILHAIHRSENISPATLYVISDVPHSSNPFPVRLASRRDILDAQVDGLRDVPSEIRMQIAEIVEAEFDYRLDHNMKVALQLQRYFIPSRYHAVSGSHYAHCRTIGNSLTLVGRLLVIAVGVVVVCTGLYLFTAPNVSTETSWREQLRALPRPLSAPKRADRSQLTQRAIHAAEQLRGNCTFRVIVFAWKRRASLRRLLQSLEVDYRGFPVHLDFHMDGEAHEKVIDFVDSYRWEHGRTRINRHAERVGLERVF
ncbi:hypothetical protein PSACC_00117 [Paramicrosporidium saccamoebae]|uniref:Uncharacterized protein n=1 Tax=Paramicrosporidium saccamoebae TaxID=1246581 RepID=A0A2H9TQV8_9FUNG|nr:hypothetical protein PSACC_00117 [Paramicrosporidium saccamoebae]